MNSDFLLSCALSYFIDFNEYILQCFKISSVTLFAQLQASYGLAEIQGIWQNNLLYKEPKHCKIGLNRMKWYDCIFTIIFFDYSLIYVITVQEHPIPVCLEDVEGIVPKF